VVVTHDQDEALTMADKIAILRDGQLEQTGSPAEVYQRPASRFIASFLGAANFFHGRVDGLSGGSAHVSLPGGVRLTMPAKRDLGSRQTSALRRGAFIVEPLPAQPTPAPPNTVDAVIEQVVYHGFVSHLYLKQANGEPLIVFQQNQPGHEVPVLAA